MTIKSICGNYEVNIMENGRNAEYGYVVTASICDGASYGGSSYWFSIGHYKTLKNAIRWAKKKMGEHGIELELEGSSQAEGKQPATQVQSRPTQQPAQPMPSRPTLRLL